MTDDLPTLGDVLSDALPKHTAPDSRADVRCRLRSEPAPSHSRRHQRARIDDSGRTSAALVYGRRLHKIDLFIWPTTAPDASTSKSSYRGFSVVHWTTNRLAYWAVSDVAATDLSEFTNQYRVNLDTEGSKPYP